MLSLPSDARPVFRLVAPAARAPSRALGPRLIPVTRVALVLLVIANLGRIPIAAVGERELPILLNDLIIGVVLALGAILFAQRRSLQLDRVAVLALLFAGIGALSTILAIPRFGLTTAAVLVSLAYLVRWLAYLAVYVVVVNAARARDVEPLWDALETAILVFAAFGILQSIFLPGFAQMVYPDARVYLDWDPQGHRLVSTFLDPNFAGAFILIGLVVGLARLAMGAPVAPWKLAILFAALLMTASRSALLAFVFGGGTILVVRGLSRGLVRAGVFAALALVAALPKLLDFARTFNKLELDASAMSRLIDWARGVAVVADNPVLGIGFNTWGFVQRHYGWTVDGGLHAANFGIAGGLLFVAALTGVVGLGFYVAMLVAIVGRARAVWRDADRPAAHRGIALGGAAMVPAILVHSLFTNSIFYPFLMEPLWVLWALTFPMLAGGAPASAPGITVPRVTARMAARSVSGAD